MTTRCAFFENVVQEFTPFQSQHSPATSEGMKPSNVKQVRCGTDSVLTFANDERRSIVALVQIECCAGVHSVSVATFSCDKCRNETVEC